MNYMLFLALRFASLFLKESVSTRSFPRNRFLLRLHTPLFLSPLPSPRGGRWAWDGAIRVMLGMRISQLLNLELMSYLFYLGLTYLYWKKEMDATSSNRESRVSFPPFSCCSFFFSLPPKDQFLVSSPFSLLWYSRKHSHSSFFFYFISIQTPFRGYSSLLHAYLSKTDTDLSQQLPLHTPP